MFGPQPFRLLSVVQNRRMTNEGGDEVFASAAAGDVTLRSYEASADLYVRESQKPDGQLLGFLDAFAQLVGAGTVLELGSGPGWDADYLERQGVRVIRTDGAGSLVDRLRQQGHSAQVLDIRQDDLGGPHDGLLANAVLLHLSREEFVQFLRRARRALRPGAVLGFTLKDGDGDGWSRAKLNLPRYFTYWRDADVRDAMGATEWRVVSIERVSGRADDWLYVLAQPE